MLQRSADSVAVRAGGRGVGHQPAEDARIGRQLEVVHPGVVGEAEVVALHPGPDAHRVVGEVLLVDVAIASEQLRGAGHELPHHQVGESEADERLDPGALLRVDVDVREVGSIGEGDPTDVEVGDRLGPRQISVVEESPVVLGRVVDARLLVTDVDLAIAEDPRV